MREGKKKEGKIINKNIGSKFQRKIHHSTLNNKWAKINIGGMGIRGEKETKKSLRDV